MTEHSKYIVDYSEKAADGVNPARHMKSGRQDPDRLPGTFLFIGRAGVGQTELARGLSEFRGREGKSRRMICERRRNIKYRYRSGELRRKGQDADTAGKDKCLMSGDIKNQLPEDARPALELCGLFTGGKQQYVDAGSDNMPD